MKKFFFLILLCFSLLFIAPTNADLPGPYWVYGHIYEGDNFVDYNTSVIITDLNTTRSATVFTTEDGRYLCNICEIANNGDVIEIQCKEKISQFTVDIIHEPAGHLEDIYIEKTPFISVPLLLLVFLGVTVIYFVRRKKWA